MRSYILVKKKQNVGYERSGNPTGDFAVIPMNVIENTGFAHPPRVYSMYMHVSPQVYSMYMYMHVSPQVYSMYMYMHVSPQVYSMYMHVCNLILFSQTRSSLFL